MSDRDQELRDKLNAVVHETLVADGFLEEGEFVGDWTMTVHVQSIVDDHHCYVQLNSSLKMSPHSQIGLMVMGLTEAMVDGEEED